MKCPLPSRCWIVKSSLTILTTITHLGETDGGRKGSQWRPRLQVGPFRGCGSAPPPSRMPLPLKKKRKKSNYSPSLTNPAGERHKLGPVKTKTCSHENCSQPAPVASPSLWGRDEAEGTTNAFRGGLTHFRRGCREKKKKLHAMSSSVKPELCAHFSMMQCPQRTDTTLLTVTPHYSMQQYLTAQEPAAQTLTTFWLTGPDAADYWEQSVPTKTFIDLRKNVGGLGYSNNEIPGGFLFNFLNLQMNWE